MTAKNLTTNIKGKKNKEYKSHLNKNSEKPRNKPNL